MKNENNISDVVWAAIVTFLCYLPAVLLSGCYEEQCVEIAEHLCVDESKYEMQDPELWVEMHAAMLQCVGFDKLPKRVFVRIEAPAWQPIECKPGTAIGCHQRLFGYSEITLPAEGWALAHELGHAIDDHISKCSSGTKKCNNPAWHHRPCGPAIGCGQPIALAFFNDDLRLDDHHDWSVVYPETCTDWRD